MLKWSLGFNFERSINSKPLLLYLCPVYLVTPSGIMGQTTPTLRSRWKWEIIIPLILELSTLKRNWQKLWLRAHHMELNNLWKNMGQLFCYLVYCTIDPRSHEDHTKWKSEKMKIRDKRQKRSCICLSNSPRHRPAWNVVFASDAEILTGPPKFLTEPPQIETKPSQPRWFPLVQLKYNWKIILKETLVA